MVRVVVEVIIDHRDDYCCMATVNESPVLHHHHDHDHHYYYDECHVHHGMVHRCRMVVVDNFDSLTFLHSSS